jgi:hypothetical protein
MHCYRRTEQGMKTECFSTDFTVNTDFAFPAKMGDIPVFLHVISKCAFSFSPSRTLH